MSKTFEEDYLDYNTKFQKNAEQQHKTYADKNIAAGTAYVNDMSEVIDANTQRATEKIEGQISALPQHYQSGYESNAIQQKINQQQLAERMANMGLTNSGLNRTQQTAINIQRSNADAALTRQKNAAMASLRSQIADVIANANSEKNTFAAQSKYDTATRNNEMYISLMTQADQRAYDRATTLDSQRYNTSERIASQDFSAAEAEKDRTFSAAEAEKDRTASANAAYIKQGLEDGSLKYNDKGEIIEAEESENNSAYKTPTKDVYQSAFAMYIALGLDKDPNNAENVDEYLDYLETTFPEYDPSDLQSYASGFSTSTVGANKGGLRGGSIDDNATVKDLEGNEYKMIDLYNALLSSGMSESDAKEYIKNLQYNKGLTWWK